ncbi:MAG: family 43 glycosylhydrolase [Verrucomicrobia bacterium]|nr:family 43 glycosylhydrolase [Verrucomicrobiota bacterium]MCH8527475.1 family 43 glycosylhydrolase [Kiritimatiellia bacterium]
MNPILPLDQYIPDVEARVWQDGRLYLYGSRDRCGSSEYCSKSYRVFSTADLSEWTDHGPSFHAKTAHSDTVLYAPDCICVDGRYVLAYCGADKSEGLAFSRSPCGPFDKSVPVPPADGDGIDPALLLDDDGEMYYFWGQIRLRAARLRPDLSGLDAATVRRDLLTEADHGFHEGASIRKRKGLYYLVYADISRGRPTCLAYAVSRSPLGPYEKRGIIIDNIGCDPETWNNHGSIAEFKGQWYVFYHRSSQGGRYNRRVCVEPIFFDGNGDIAEVEMTTQGAGGPMDPLQPMPACRACQLTGNIRVDVTDSGEHVLAGMRDGDGAVFRYFHFSGERLWFEAEWCNPPEAGWMELYLDRPGGPFLGFCSQKTDWRIPDCETPAGVRALCVVYRGTPAPENCGLLGFTFGGK